MKTFPRIPLLALGLLIGSALATAPAAAPKAPKVDELALAGPVDFTITHLVEQPSEGPDLPRPCFSVGKRRMAFHEPAKCEISSNPSQITLLLSNRGVLGQITVSVSTLRPEVAFGSEIDTYFKSASANLPSDAQEVKFDSAKNDLFTVNGWSSLSFDWEYSAFDRRSRRQVSYINIDPVHQVQVTIACDQAHWKEVSGVATSFLHSWYLLDESGTYFRK